MDGSVRISYIMRACRFTHEILNLAAQVLNATYLERKEVPQELAPHEIEVWVHNRRHVPHHSETL